MDNTDFLYILDDEHQVVHAPNYPKWMEWIGEAATSGKDRVGFDKITEGKAVAYVVTNFFGLDLSGGKKDPPELFSTSIYGPSDDLYLVTRRYQTWEQAVEGHQQVVKQVKKEIGNGAKSGE